MRQQIEELTEKLRFANETIAMMEDKAPSSFVKIGSLEEVK